MSDELGRKVVRLVLIGMGCLILVVGYVFYQNYQGRNDLVEAQRKSCERAKKDRNANAAGWRIAETARRAEGQFDVAEKYSRIATGLERRGRIICAIAFPKESVLP